ncbi:BON domain-containing protein [Pseudoduganella namucuonensis]|uniref:Osmotically-inducible protein Y n=1 Tax=Pseudoduganella namucuonensis TaxID=1035707 RepID=A0A1I7J4X6_9BURK|nr:BON domain-containing protein [Pseudoduganella namucuonensis]SFU80191.1 BON domain-containing protein [Pseudoduganella namucuonensis]
MKIVKSLPALLSALTLSALAACASTPTTESTGEYIDDSVVTANVKAAMVLQPELKASEINVETYKGAVQLSGFVSSQEDIDKAVAAARSINGVKSVTNDMRLK